MDDPPAPSAPAEPASSGPSVSASDTISTDEARQGTEPPPRHGAGRWPLRRSVRDRKLRGVAGGVATAADIDPTLVRLLFAVAAFSGWGIVAYVVLAVVLQDETVEDPARPLPREPRRMLRIGLGVAAFVAVGRLFDGWFFTGGDIGLPFLLIAAGAAVLWARRDPTPPEPLEPGPEPGGLDAATATAAWPVAPPPPPLGPGIDWRSTGHDLLRLAAAFAAVGALLALVGGAFLVAVGAVPMRLPFLPAAIGTIGLLGLVFAVVRRGRISALFLSGGVLVVAVALAAGLASFPGGAGNRIFVVGPDAPLLDRYEHSAGRLVLDLGQLTLPPGSQRRVVAEVGAGQLTVIVPSALTTDVDARAGAGNTTLFGREQSGAGVSVTASHAGAAGSGRLELDLDVGVGQISVELAAPPTFDVTCQVPAEAKGDGTDPVSCPHPAFLATTPMTCSVALAGPEGSGHAGQAFCRERGAAVPKVGRFAATCQVPADSQEATCAPLTPQQRKELEDLRRSTITDPPVPASVPAPAAAPVPGAGDAPLTCGPPDAAGERTCTTTPPSSTTTTTPASYRCKDDPATGQLICRPA